MKQPSILFHLVRTVLLLVFLATKTTCEEEQQQQQQQSPIPYGVDVSYPMHHAKTSNNYAWLPHNLDPSIETPPEYKDMPIQPLGDTQTPYEEMIKACSIHYGDKGDTCYSTERGRVAMSLRQPKGVYNYTKLGYKKMKAPEKVFKLIRNFWETNKDKQKPEVWPAGYTYTNHWSSPTYMASVEDTSLEGGGIELKRLIWEAARDTISEWTGQQLVECSLYGIRIYTEGSVLAPHVDRLPLVSSAIINVDQDVDEPWPIEVIGHDGVAVNVTMEPGDIVLYESHSILHGRPFPLKGRFFANIFVHFEPLGPVGEKIETIDGDLPKYLIRGSEEEANWRKTNPDGYHIMQSTLFNNTIIKKPDQFGRTDLHRAAIMGEKSRLQSLLESSTTLINAKDKNGWTPLHEAVRAGKVEIVETLLSNGADLNAVTNSHGSTLWLAQQFHDASHEVVKFLEQLGATRVAPGGAHDEL